MLVCGTNVLNMFACTASDGVLYDSTPPVVGRVCDGLSSSALCGSMENRLNLSHLSGPTQLHLLGFSDADSGILAHEWSLGSVAGSSDVLSPRDIGLRSSIVFDEIERAAVVGRQLWACRPEASTTVVGE